MYKLSTYHSACVWSCYIFFLVWKEWSSSKDLLDTHQVGRRESETTGSLLCKASCLHVGGFNLFNGCWFRQAWSDTSWFGSERSPPPHLVWRWTCWGSMSHTQVWVVKHWHRDLFGTMTKWRRMYMSLGSNFSSFSFIIGRDVDLPTFV